MGMGSININNYKQSSFFCPWARKRMQAACTLYVDDAADNFYVDNSTESIVAAGVYQNQIITGRMTEGKMAQNVSKHENLLYLAGQNSIYLEAKLLREQ
eukprot:4202997-Pyramimonas_sp.AAC.1